MVKIYESLPFFLCSLHFRQGKVTAKNVFTKIQPIFKKIAKIAKKY
jgi:Ethanolamine utilization protein EutJ (predicted chaperonin)